MTKNVIKLGKKISPKHRRPKLKKPVEKKPSVVTQAPPRAEAKKPEPLKVTPSDEEKKPQVAAGNDEEAPALKPATKRKRRRRKPVEPKAKEETVKADNTPVEGE